MLQHFWLIGLFLNDNVGTCIIRRAELDVSAHKSIKNMLLSHDEEIFLCVQHNFCTNLLLLISLSMLSGFGRRLSILGKKRVNDDILLLSLLSDVLSSILSILLGPHTRGTVSHARLSILIINYSTAFRHNSLAARYVHMQRKYK